MEEMFFDQISEFYDDMVGFDAALDRRSGMLQKFITPEMKYAADIGCGTGLDSISLTRLGLNVRSFDPSRGMLEQAAKNAEKYGAKIKFYQSGYENIPAEFESSFDLAVSLGNTLANVPVKNSEASLRRIYSILKPGGRVLLQILNYPRLKKLNERIINITRNESEFFVRFYDFADNLIHFNILRFNASDPKNRTLQTTPLYPYSADELLDMLLKLNFRNIEFFGGLNHSAYDINISPDLIVSAYR